MDPIKGFSGVSDLSDDPILLSHSLMSPQDRELVPHVVKNGIKMYSSRPRRLPET